MSSVSPIVEGLDEREAAFVVQITTYLVEWLSGQIAQKFPKLPEERHIELVARSAEVVLNGTMFSQADGKPNAYAHGLDLLRASHTRQREQLLIALLKSSGMENTDKEAVS